MKVWGWWWEPLKSPHPQYGLSSGQRWGRSEAATSRQPAAWPPCPRPARTRPPCWRTTTPPSSLCSPSGTGRRRWSQWWVLLSTQTRIFRISYYPKDKGFLKCYEYLPCYEYLKKYFKDNKCPGAAAGEAERQGGNPLHQRGGGPGWWAGEWREARARSHVSARGPRQDAAQQTQEIFTQEV